MSKKSCDTCRDNGGPCAVGCLPEYLGWKPKTEIIGVASPETVTNESGGRQSKLDYRFDLIDAKALFSVAKVMHEGVQKYEVDNWRKIDANSHLNHAITHIYAYLAGDKQDEHLEHAACRVLMALGVKK